MTLYIRSRQAWCQFFALRLPAGGREVIFTLIVARAEGRNLAKVGVEKGAASSPGSARSSLVLSAGISAWVAQTYPVRPHRW